MSYLQFSFAKRKYIINAAKFWVVLAAVFILLALDIVWLIKRRHTVGLKPLYGLPPVVLVISVAIILGIILLTVWVMFQVDKLLDRKMEEYVRNYEFAHKGDKGEELVNKELQKILNPQEYRIFRNTVLPGRHSDIDFIVVGAKGVIVLEIKNYDTKTIFTYGKPYYINQNGQTEPLKKDYRAIVKWQAENLERFLYMQGFKVKVRKALVYLNPQSVDIRDNGNNKYGVYVAVGLDGLDKFVAGCYPDNQFRPNYYTAICNSLMVK